MRPTRGTAEVIDTCLQVCYGKPMKKMNERDEKILAIENRGWAAVRAGNTREGRKQFLAALRLTRKTEPFLRMHLQELATATDWVLFSRA